MVGARKLLKQNMELEEYSSTVGNIEVFQKNLNASKPSEHSPLGEKFSTDLFWNRNKNSSRYQTGSPM